MKANLHQHRRYMRLLSAVLRADQYDREGRSAKGTLDQDDALDLGVVRAAVSRRHPGSAGEAFVFALVVHHVGDIYTMQRALLWADQTRAQNGRHSQWLYEVLFDRIRLMQDRPQRYGTQYRKNPSTGEFELWPMEDQVA